MGDWRFVSTVPGEPSAVSSSTPATLQSHAKLWKDSVELVSIVNKQRCYVHTVCAYPRRGGIDDGIRDRLGSNIPGPADVFGD